ncbi:MAG: hypothetical protein ACPG4T_19375, partial [Nannocystaceae bacterium]
MSNRKNARGRWRARAGLEPARCTRTQRLTPVRGPQTIVSSRDFPAHASDAALDGPCRGDCPANQMALASFSTFVCSSLGLAGSNRRSE